MFVTGLNTDSLIRREPALADFDPNYATNFPDRINEAKAVIDNRLRASGYDLDKIGLKTSIFDFDNDAGTTVAETVSEPAAGQLLLVLVSNASKSVTVAVTGSNGQTIASEAITVSGAPSAVILPYSDVDGITVTITADTSIAASSLCVYLTDPAVYFVHLYKALHLIYESFISEPGDLFERKAETYRMAYENEFNTMVTYYDRNGDGTTDENDGQRPMKQVRFMR